MGDTTIESSLHVWLHKCGEFIDETDCAEDMECFLVVGSAVFQNENEVVPLKLTLKEVCDNLSSSTGYKLDKNVSFDVLTEALLICAVSAACSKRGLFVQIIMELDAGVQSHLMEAIKTNLADHDLERIQGEIDDDIHEEEKEEEGGEYRVNPAGKDMEAAVNISHSSNSNTSFIASENEGIVMNCSECKEKDKRIERLDNDLESAIAAHNELEVKLRAELSQLSNKLVDCDQLLMDKDEHVNESATLCNELKHKIEDLEVRLKCNDNSSEQISALQDEIDVLRPRAEKLEKAETQIEKLREKIDELKDVKSQLKKEQTDHTETFSRLVNVEKEVELFHKTKAQLEEYRAQYAEANIKIEELTLRVTQKDEQLQELISQNSNLSGSQKNHVFQTQSLADELRATTEHLREMERVGGIGEQMSELNPALMQELEKLRNEKASLLEKLDTTSMESLNKLEKDLADQKAMASSLQSKWVTTKDSLASAMATIASLYATQTSLMESLEMSKSDSEAIVHENFVKTQNIVASHNDAIMNITFEKDALIDAANNTIKEHEQTIGTKIMELSYLQDVHNDMAENLEHANLYHEEVNKKRKLEDEEKDTEMMELKKAHTESINSIKQQTESKMKSLIDIHDAALTAEVSKAKNIEADLEEERLKRRRADRESKIHREEASRYKAQLTCSGAGSGTASGGDIDAALRELKQMSTQLEEKNQEIAHLKANGKGKIGTYSRTTRSSASASTSGVVSSSSSGPQRIKNDNNNSYCSGFMEHSELSDKKIEQLNREKRELIAKHLEENKEKLEIQQKLMLSEKENASLKSKLTKLTLEKERAERRMALAKEKQVAQSCHNMDCENIAPLDL